MKVSAVSLLLSLGVVNAFSPAPRTTSLSTQLHLFGGGDKKAGAGGGGGMMDQLAMFKKAQEMSQKKKKLDDELAAMDFKGSDEDGKVTGTFKYIPVTNPMDPQPEFMPEKFEFDNDWYESASPEDIATAVQASIKAGMEECNKAMAEKYNDCKHSNGSLNISGIARQVLNFVSEDKLGMSEQRVRARITEALDCSDSCL